MYDNYNYPEGADTPDAPWNEQPNDPKKIYVTVSVTLSKTVPIEVTDYNTIVDEETGDTHIDYSSCDLEGAVESQIYLPQQAGKILSDSDVSSLESLADYFSNWNVDELEVIPE